MQFKELLLGVIIDIKSFMQIIYKDMNDCRKATNFTYKVYNI